MGSIMSKERGFYWKEKRQLLATITCSCGEHS